MIVIVKKDPNPEKLQYLKDWLLDKNLEIHETIGEESIVFCVVGDTSRLDLDALYALDIVESVKRVKEPYRRVNRRTHPEDTVISIPVQTGADGVEIPGSKDGMLRIGGGNLTLIAGPCSVETEEQIIKIAKSVKASGANLLRGGAFKPRTSPYSFQGLGEEGLRLLSLAKKETGLPIVTEIMEISQLEYFDDVDIIQVGTRNMQNYNLLKELGAQKKPVLLKRGMNATYEDWLMSAEYILSEGNDKVIMCERGVRTFENYTRNTLDLAAVPVLKKLSHLPVIVDPSHATGRASLVPTMSMAAVASGADGVMIEVHNDPEHAWCDGPQALHLEEFEKVANKLRRLHSVVVE